MACAGILALELLSAALHEPLNSPHSPERFIRLKSARTTQPHKDGTESSLRQQVLCASLGTRAGYPMSPSNKFKLTI